jgi:nucleoside-diphosphate-sugar epimerase
VRGDHCGTRTILLTGGTGFLGGNLLFKLVEDDFRVIVLTRSSSDVSRIAPVLERVTLCTGEKGGYDALFRDHQIDVILHCATNYGRKEMDPLALLEANLFLPLKLLECGSRRGVTCFINTDTILDKRVNAYSLSKNQFKDWLKLYAQRITCVNVALEHFYGPLDDETKFVTHVIRSILHNVEVLPLTRGEQKRDFIFIEDVIEAFVKIIRHTPSIGTGYYPFEIGSGQSLSIRDFVTLVKRLAGDSQTVLDFGALSYRDHEVMESVVDTSAVRALGWNPKVSLEEGLRRTITVEKNRS